MWILTVLWLLQRQDAVQSLDKPRARQSSIHQLAKKTKKKDCNMGYYVDVDLWRSRIGYFFLIKQVQLSEKKNHGAEQRIMNLTWRRKIERIWRVKRLVKQSFIFKRGQGVEKGNSIPKKNSLHSAALTSLAGISHTTDEEQVPTFPRHMVKATRWSSPPDKFWTWKNKYTKYTLS